MELVLIPKIYALFGFCRSLVRKLIAVSSCDIIQLIKAILVPNFVSIYRQLFGPYFWSISDLRVIFLNGQSILEKLSFFVLVYVFNQVSSFVGFQKISYLIVVHWQSQLLNRYKKDVQGEGVVAF